MNVRGLPEPIPFEMGLQVSRCVRAQATAESNLRANSPATGCDLPCAGSAKGVSDHRRPPDARPCAHVNRDSTQAPGCFCDRVFEREERHCYRPSLRQGTKLYGRAFLGSRLRSIHRRVRTGTGPHLHPRARSSGWSRWTILNQPMRRATRDA